MSLVQWIEFPVLGDGRGSLIAIESAKTVPFEVKRAYYIFNTQKGISRGFHAHKALKQLAICVSGTCRMVLDDGVTKESVWIDSPERGVLIEAMIWHEMHDFSENCVFLVLASEHYDEADYIRDYKDFIEEIEKT